MSELGDRFLLALADQGYLVSITDEDVVIILAEGRGRWHTPRELVENPELEMFLQLAIAGFVQADGRFRWPPRPGAGRS